MTWINDTVKHLKKKYMISPVWVKENFKTRYKKYHHRAAFRFTPVESTHSGIYFGRNSWRDANELRHALESLGDSVKVRNEWTETFVYFVDIDEFLRAVPKKHRKSLTKLELMSPAAIDAKENFEHDYPVSLTVAKRLPHKRYRYRVYVASSGKVRSAIGINNLEAIYQSIAAYEGIKFTDAFSRTHSYRWCNSSTYFYAETLDWLPLLVMLEPRYIKRIEEIKTSEEIENEATAQNTVTAQLDSQ